MTIPYDELMQKEFDEISKKYSYLAKTVSSIIEEFLSKKNIEYSDVVYRIKTYESFIEKIKRKGYQDPFNDIIDICGIRIIYLYNKDLKEIISILATEFNVEESENKIDDLNPDQFGYRSHHIVATIKTEWAMAPQYRDSGGLKIEFQVRSLLMHSWANISHQLFYKKETYSTLIKRRLFRLSALMEMADSEIDSLLLAEGHFAPVYDLQALQAVLDNHFPERIKSDKKLLAKLANEMYKHKLSIKKLDSLLAENKVILLNIEREVFPESEIIKGVETRWMQIGIARAVMYLTWDSYWFEERTEYTEKFVAIIEKYRQK